MLVPYTAPFEAEWNGVVMCFLSPHWRLPERPELRSVDGSIISVNFVSTAKSWGNDRLGVGTETSARLPVAKDRFLNLFHWSTLEEYLATECGLSY